MTDAFDTALDAPGEHAPSTPWGWLKGFAWFLLAWPVLSLLALDELTDQEWDSILIAMLGPAAIGLVLLGVERLLTRLFRDRFGHRPQPPPGMLRDLSNVGLCLAILLGIDIALVLTFESQNLFVAEPGAGQVAGWLLAGSFGSAVVLRIAHRLLAGKARRADLGTGWRVPSILRLFGYLCLIPTLLVSTVMVDYTLRGDFDYFGWAGWIAFPILLWLGLRSAMASNPRFWARSPWEVWLRTTSLTMPWWAIAFLLSVGMAFVFMLVPFFDEEMTTAGKVIAGVILGPIGLLILWFAWTVLRDVPRLFRRIAIVRTLARRPGALVKWSVDPNSPTDVVLHLRGGRSCAFPLQGAAGETDPLLSWLSAQAEAASRLDAI